MDMERVKAALEWMKQTGGPIGAEMADGAFEELKNDKFDQDAARSDLRDTFAAAALTGLCANTTLTEQGHVVMDGKDVPFQVAAYAIADAMLAAREGK